MKSPRRSPLLKLLGAAFLLSTNVLALSAVLGVDLGTEYIKAALVKPGIPLEIVLTKDSRRKETLAVAFKPAKGALPEGQYPERSYGADAMAIAARFPGEVYPNLKPLLGLPVGDAIVQEYAARHPALKLQAHPTRGTAAFKTETLSPEEEAWMVEELLAMELQSIQKNAEVTAGGDSSIRSIVLTVPPFYTTEEKRALQMAAELAGFKVLSLVSDGLAVGLNYATSRQFPNINEGAKPEYHLVFDMGAGSTTATVMRFQSRTVKDVGKFNKTVQEIQVLGSGWDRTLGGDSLNSLIVDDMIAQFVGSNGAQKISATAEQIQSHGRAVAKLSKEAERLRHVLSANQKTQASFEGLYEDVDFKYKISRADFETMAEAHVERIGAAIKDALKAANLEIGDLTSVILHGGATRTPLVHKAIEKALGSGDKIRSNVNSDEAAVFGAAFRAAELSPSFRVKEIRISEGANYPAGITWKAANGKVQRQRLWTAPSPLGGPAKEITFTEQEDFTGSFYQQVDTEDKLVKSFATKNLTASVAALKEKYPTCADTGVQFKAAVKLRTENGEVAIVKAAVECEAEVVEKEGFVDGVKNLFGFGKKDQKPLAEGDKDNADASSDSEAKTEEASSATESSSTSSTKSGDAVESTDAAKAEVKKKQIVSIPVEVTLEKAGIPQLTKAEWTKAKDRLKAFAASDKARLQREEALNQLEAFTYKIRDLVDSEAFISASTEAERQTLSEKASEASDWLYEEGDAATKDDFVAKLKALQDLVAPIQTRLDEAERRPGLITDLRNILNTTNVFIDTVRGQIAAYDEWKATASDKAAESATSSAAAETTSNDFEGLEDEDDSSKEAEEEKPVQEEVVPPLHNSEEIDTLEALYKETLEWLNKLEVQQADVPLTEEPVLIVSELVARRDALDKASLNLALKSYTQYQKNKPKKPTKSKKAKKQDKTKSADKAGQTFEFPEGSVPLSNEELEELVKKYMKEEEDTRRQAEGGQREGKQAEEKPADDTQKPGHDEL
ncbi:ER-resident heat shock protein [Trichoderma novae-zelandiae]